MIALQLKTKRLKKVLLSVLPDGKIYLFGSHAKESAKPWSDIDVAIVSKNLGKDYWAERQKLEKLIAKIDDDFELHLFKPEDFNNPYDPLVSEIKKYGLLV